MVWERVVLRMVSTVSTAPYHGFQVAFSPYSPNKIAFIGAQNYGIAGEEPGAASSGCMTFDPLLQAPVF